MKCSRRSLRIELAVTSVELLKGLIKVCQWGPSWIWPQLPGRPGSWSGQDDRMPSISMAAFT